jgi:hypothetical protein
MSPAPGGANARFLFAEYLLFSQSPSQQNHFWIIDEQHRDRHPANLCPTLKFRTVPHEVFRPVIGSRMKQADKLTRFWVKPRNVRPFDAIAMHASKGEILVLSWAAMLTSDDVIDLKWSGMEGGRQLTIFAPRVGSLPNLADKIRIQWAYLLGRPLQRAARLRLHGRDEISDVDVAVEFGLLLTRQLPLPRQLRKLVHPVGVSIVKTN